VGIDDPSHGRISPRSATDEAASSASAAALPWVAAEPGGRLAVEPAKAIEAR
jgi:hypothetical protein